MVLKCNDELGVGRLGHIAYQRRALCSLVRRVEPYVVGRPAAGVLGDYRLLWVSHLSKRAWILHKGSILIYTAASVMSDKIWASLQVGHDMKAVPNQPLNQGLLIWNVMAVAQWSIISRWCKHQFVNASLHSVNCMLTLFRHTSVRYSIPTISHSYLLREKSRILIGGVQMSTATPAEQTTTTPASTDAPPLVMQIVVRRDLMDVRTFLILLPNFSNLLMYSFPGGGLGRRTLDGAGSSRHCCSK